MIRSMTGYGASRRIGPLGAIAVEIRSINNRFLDVVFRGVSEWREWEVAARQAMRGRVHRGKVDVTVSWEPPPEARPRVHINREALEAVIEEARDFAQRLEVSPLQLIGPLAGVPGVLETRPAVIDAQALHAELNAALGEALDRFEEARAREGRALAEDLCSRARSLRRMRASIDGLKGAVVERYRARLKELAASLSEGAQAALDPGRLEAEATLYADRCDVSEELARLGAHLDDLEAKLGGGGVAAEGASEPLGKALEFLVQELLRETNTIGSKARDTEMIQTVLQMKNEIEKIREQVQNIE